MQLPQLSAAQVPPTLRRAPAPNPPPATLLAMAGRRLVDAAKLFSASRSIAQKHIALRARQYDVYSQTSTVARAVKSQTDRITLTAAAALALSKRLSEEAPTYAKAAVDRTIGLKPDHIPARETVKRHAPRGGAREGLQQDHHYEQSEQNTANNPPPEEELEIEQQEAPRRPLPDGTIPSAELTLEPEEQGKDTFSERPVSEAPKKPLAEDHDAQVRHDDDGLKPVESNEPTIPLPGKPTGASVQATEAIPAHALDLQPPSASPQIVRLQEGHDRDVFYSRSVESTPSVSSQHDQHIPTHTGTNQEGDVHVKDSELNQDVFYSVPRPEKVQEQTVAGDGEVPEGINTDVFHSKRVARMLGTDAFSRKEHLARQSIGRHPLDDRAMPHTNVAPQFRVSERTQSSGSEKPAQATASAQEIESIASQLDSSNAAASKVHMPRFFA